MKSRQKLLSISKKDLTVEKVMKKLEEEINQ